MKNKTSFSDNDIAELLGSLVLNHSPSGQEQEAIAHMKELFKIFSFDVEIQKVKNRSNIIAFKSTKLQPTLLFCSHIDTIPAEGSLIGAIEKNKYQIKGLGACDAKGSIIAMFLAFQKLIRLDIGKRIAFALFVGEEETGDGGITFLRREYLPKYAIVGEPTDLKMPSSQAGYLHLSLNATCIPRHAFSLHGIDAMELLVTGIYKIKQLINELNEPLSQNEKSSLFIKELQGGSSDMFWYLRHKCSASIVINVHPSWDVKKVVYKIKNIIKRILVSVEEAEIKLSIKSWDPGIIFSSPILNLALSNALSFNGLSTSSSYMRSWTDASTLEWKGIKTIVFGPGSLQHAHSPKEYILIKDIKIAAQIYYDTAIALFKSINGGKEK